MLELTHYGLYVMYKIDEIKSDIIVQNDMGYLQRSQIGRKVERTSSTKSVIYCYNFLQQLFRCLFYLYLILFVCSVCKL